MYSDEFYYTQDHEWVKVEGENALVGITEFAQKQLGDVVYLELPKKGDQFEFHQTLGVVESVKAAFDIYAPVSGTVTKVNSVLESNPAQTNQDCYGSGWLFEIEMSSEADWDALMPAEEYENHLKQEAK